MGRRLIAVGVVALALTGLFQPLALAQQQSQSDPFREPVTPARPPRPRGTDAYDVGAGVMTVIGMPLKGIVCFLGGATGLTLYIFTFGSADRASAAIVREGCNQRWIVRGDDIRPDPPSSRVVEWDKQDMGVGTR
jgi:hypothetical protein